MIAVVDRLVQYPNRYKLTNSETGEVLGTFDVDEVAGTVQQVGTEINKALFDSIAADLAARVVSNGGELSKTIVTFPDISGTAANVASGDTSATLWGKVKNWFSRLKALAFKDTIRNSDVASNAAIAQSKISGLEGALDAKANNADLAAIAKSGDLADATQDATHRVVTDTEKATWNKKQNAITGAASTIASQNLTANRALVSNGSGKVAVSAVTATELGYLDGVTSSVQTQLNRKYVKPSGGIPASDLAQAVQTSLDRADSALQSAPVTSVAGKTGAVSLSKSDVGLSNVDNVKQYSASNPPPYPVTSVNGKTGAVNLDAAAVGAATSAQGKKADSAAQPSKEQDWSANQNFNAGFSALNGNFAFSDTTNIGMEIGRRDGTAGTPYIDFHTDGSSSTDYNSRILATGNQLQVTASGGFSVNGHNIDELDMVVDSGNAITMTAPASGDTVQAPANGWFCLSLHSTGNGFVKFIVKKSDGTDKWGAVNFTTNYTAGWPIYFLPVKSGDYVMITFNNATTNRLQFIRSTKFSDI